MKNSASTQSTSNPSLQIAATTRVFMFRGSRLTDPNPSLSPEEVGHHYATLYPEIASADLIGPEFKNGTAEYTWRHAAGSKG